MISQLTGTVADLRPTSVVLDVSGVGFLVACTPNTSAGLTRGTTATLHTHLAVREDALTLYGFSSPHEREAFIMVQSVTGIGPKLALAIVSHLTASQVRQAILAENLVALSKVPGVGRKTAQRLVLELKDKAAALPGTTDQATPDRSGWQDQVVTGLQGLGYSARDADAAWEAVREQAGDGSATVSDLMRAALKSLAKG
ncbi:MAG: Holliday junction branch migration protein RuvA [Propionibacteriaceae bacterium]|nr:Holliday junction branch migration protein RuvA [Propionibacteriaceae bacterium]